MIIPKSSLPPCNRFIHPHPLSYDFAVSFSRKGGVFISASLTLGMAMGLTSANKILVNVTKTVGFLELVWFCLTLVLLLFAVRREYSDQLLALLLQSQRQSFPSRSAELRATHVAVLSLSSYLLHSSIAEKYLIIIEINLVLELCHFLF